MKNKIFPESQKSKPKEQFSPTCGEVGLEGLEPSINAV